MIELFVYNWFYTGYTVYGHCLDTDGDYKLLTVRNFKPSCYIEGERLPSTEVVPCSAIQKMMVTSRDISVRRSFYHVFFKNTNDMELFVSEIKPRSRVHMADIPQINIFLSQINADHIGWIQVPSYNINSPNVITVLQDKNPYPNPKVMVFDIEVYSQDSGMPRSYRIDDTVEMISVVVYNTGDISRKKVYVVHKCQSSLFHDECIEIKCSNETEVIKEFFNVIKSEDPTIITGFNLYGFDIKYLVSRLQLKLDEIPDVSRGVKGSIDVIKVDWSSDAYGHNKYDRLVIGGRIIVDMYLYFKRMKLDRYSLDYVSKKFIDEGKHDMPTEEMMSAFKSGDYCVNRKVAMYCIQDSVLVMKLFDKVQMWIDVCEVSKIMRCEIENIYTRGEQMKLISQCVKACIDREIVLQISYDKDTWEQYEGAYVLEPEKGEYNCCSLLDFQSLYPSIIIAYNICPSTYCRRAICTDDMVNVGGKHCFRREPIGLLPGMIKSLIEERKAVKEKMTKVCKDSMTYTVLDRRQNALKICANSVYGMMGFKKSRYFGHVGCADSVTAIGRRLLSEVVDYIRNDFPVKVIYGDTDSCMLCPNTVISKESMIELSEDICNRITLRLPQPMVLKFESYYDKVLLLTKKRYILVNDGKATYKGVMSARRDYCKYAKNMYEGIIDMIAKGSNKDEIKEYIDNKMLLLLFGRCNISDMVITKSLAKDINSYEINHSHVVMARRLMREKNIEIPAGTRLEYIFVEGDGNQADKMRTLDEVKLNKLRIDGQYYIKKQILTQIDDILSIIGLGTYIKDVWIRSKK